MIYILYIFIFLFGLIIGSFLNCLIWRLHTRESLFGRSYCPVCRRKISWYDNIPLLSFIILGGKCRHCQAKISWQYPLVELIIAVLFLLSWQIELNNFGGGLVILINDSKFLLSILRDWLVVSVMAIIFIYDLRWYLILDIITLPAALVILILNLFIDFDWLNLLFSAIIGGSFFLFQFIISRGKWIGGGDIRLGLLIGVSLGWPNVILAIILAYFIGSLVGLSLIFLKKKRWGSKLPLGVFLSTASIIALFWGGKIIAWYFNLF